VTSKSPQNFFYCVRNFFKCEGFFCSSKGSPNAAAIGRTQALFQKVLKQYPDLDITSRDDAKCSAVLTKLLGKTKKKDRLDFVRGELRIRLYQRGLYHSIPRLGKAGMDRLALVLHCAERGQQIQLDFFPCTYMDKYIKMSVEQ